MLGERVPVEICKGINGLNKVILREVCDSSAEFGEDGKILLPSWPLYIETREGLVSGTCDGDANGRILLPSQSVRKLQKAEKILLFSKK